MSNYSVDAPSIGKITISIFSEDININGDSKTFYRAKSKIRGILFVALGDTENLAYSNLLKLIDEFSFTAYFNTTNPSS